MARKQKRDRSAAARKGWITRKRNAKRRSHPRKKRMWRVTIGAPYEIRKPRAKKSKRKESPDSAAYMVRGWYASRSSAYAAVDRLEEIAEVGRDTVLEENPKAFLRPKYEKLNVEIREVEYDENLLDIIDEASEVVK